MASRIWQIGVGLLVVGLLAACGGGGTGGVSQPAGSTKVTLSEYSFSPNSLSVASGTAVFYLVNVGAVAHNMTIQDASGNQVASSDLLSPGDSEVFTVNSLAPGTYTFYCNQDDHKAKGMTGTLTVT